MKKNFRILLFVILMAFLFIDTFFAIPKIIHNLIYGIAGAITLFFLMTQRKELGLNDFFNKKEESFKEEK